MHTKSEHDILLNEILFLSPPKMILNLLGKYNFSIPELIIIKHQLTKNLKKKCESEWHNEYSKKGRDPCRSSTKTNG